MALRSLDESGGSSGVAQLVSAIDRLQREENSEAGMAVAQSTVSYTLSKTSIGGNYKKTLDIATSSGGNYVLQGGLNAGL